MPTWSSPSKKTRSPGCSWSAETGVPKPYCAAAKWGSEMPSWAYTYITSPEQSKPRGEPGARLRLEPRLPARLRNLERGHLGLDLREQLLALGEHALDLPALCVELREVGCPLQLSRLETASCGGIARTRPRCLDREVMVCVGDGLRRLEVVDHLADARAAEQDRKRCRRAVALVESDHARAHAGDRVGL